ncbi:hypothetical protein ACIBBD_03230 [Streptomyces sp. NPDC051315]|uniref:hypothetical protein n=1 Tax=Streptomyces sp. NPDC051315 TaxID=3365650 RepID=UPI0037B92856
MNHQADDERHFEELVRELMTEDAYTIQPSAAPYPAIRRRGVVERRRRVAVTGAALVALAAVPAGAYAVAGGNGGGGADTATPMSSVSAPHSPAAQASEQAGAGGLLLDGVTAGQAADGLEKCLAYDNAKPGGGLEEDYLGKAGDYRILLAMRSTGDSNAPGDGHYVVAVKEKTDVRLICNVKGGEVTGINISSPDAGPTGPVVADINAGKLYQQSVLDKGNWTLPFRWGVIGTVEPSVAKVTVSYGGGDTTATLDGRWFVAAGVLDRQVTLAPHIKGYDDAGRLVYDSDHDETYEKTLP